MEVLKLLSDHGSLIEPDAMKFILSQRHPREFIKEFLRGRDALPLVLTLDDLRPAENVLSFEKYDGESGYDGRVGEPAVQKNEVPDPQTALPRADETGEYLPEHEKDEKESDSPALSDGESPDTKPPPSGGPAPDLYGDLRIISDITGNSTCEGNIENFARYFKDRYATLRRVVRLWQKMRSATSIKGATRREDEVKIICIINEVSHTKNGHTLLKVEDDTGKVTVLITKENELSTHTFIEDEIIGLAGIMRRSKGNFRDADEFTFYPNDIQWPDVPRNRAPNRSREDVEVLFMSDIHVGSSHFLADEFDKFIDWLNNGDDTHKIRYIVVAGDLVDGIGIYPNQQDELSILDIMEQYRELGRLLGKFPKHMGILLQPGNHDSVRPAEPQPALEPEIRKMLESPNIKFMGNPCFFTLHGVGILAYHGRSVDDLIGAIPSLTYQTPLLAMREMLKRRHLAPIYGGKTPIAPEDKDYLVINPIPDILVTGHIHDTGVENYKNTIMVCASAWQSQTPFQLMHNFHPDPAKVVIVNLKTGKWRIKDFSE